MNTEQNNTTPEQPEQATYDQAPQDAATADSAAVEQNDNPTDDHSSLIAKLEEQLKLEKARAANALYEAEKVKERIEREADIAKKFALEKFAKGLLDSVDNLERAIAAAGDERSPLLEGVELTLKSLLATLEKHDIRPVSTEQGFNAEVHQAVGIEPSAKAGEIGNVLQKGYTLNDRLLRPAMVTVGQ